MKAKRKTEKLKETNQSAKNILPINELKKNFNTKKNLHKDEEEISISDYKTNNTLSNKYENSTRNNYFFNYDYNNSDIEKNITSSCEEAQKRRILMKKPLKLHNKNINSKISLSKKILNHLSLRNIINKFFLNHKIKNEDEKEKSDSVNINTQIIKTKSTSHFKTYNTKNNINILNKKYLTESNFSNNMNKRAHKKLIAKYFTSRNARNKRLLPVKSNSYNNSKKLLKKINDMKTKKNSSQKISEIYSYIKVNKRNNLNKSEKADTNKMNYKKSNENISIYKEEKNVIKKGEQKISHCHSQEIFNYYEINNSSKKNSNKNSKNSLLNVNKTENNNIFLNKVYQSRFKQKPKTNIIKNDIFTTEKQKEYNTLIVKKKSNYLNSLVSNININNNINNNRDWVHRLYDEEIKKQKLKDKIVYLLRKSILTDSSINKTRKGINKSYKNERNNEYFNINFDNNFNIINLFLSEEKKEKNKTLGKYKGFQNNQYKKINPNYYENNKLNENKEQKTNDLNKNNALRSYRTVINCNRRSRAKNRKCNNKNFLFLNNEEIINEEDEEKEKIEDEK